MDGTLDHRLLPTSFTSSLLWLLAMLVSWWLWSRRRRRLSDDFATVAMGGIAGGLLGAKLGYVIAEAPIWWHDLHFWPRMIAGKTVLGGLLGGWWGIEIGKRVAGESKTLGDDFARVVPVGIAIGRLGCLFHGCCPGRPLAEIWPASFAAQTANLGLERWPAAASEIAFQLTFLATSWATANVKWLQGQHFHVYLMAYGSFRLMHEFVRHTVRYPGTPFSPYMILAAICIAGGVIGFWRRRQAIGNSLAFKNPRK